MASNISWTLEVDWNNDGIFSGSLEPSTFTGVNIKRGRDKRVAASGRGQVHPDNESFTITMWDDTGRYDMFNTSSPLYSYLGAPGLLCKLVAYSNQSATYQTMFVGVLTSTDYEPVKKKSTLKGVGLAKWLTMGSAAQMYSASQDENTHDSWFIWNGTTPSPVNYWKGRANGLPLRECAKIVLEQSLWPFTKNYGTIIYNSEMPDYFYLDGSSAWEILKDLADGFAASIYFLRDGTIYIKDRADTFGTSGYQNVPGYPLEAKGIERSNPFDSMRNSIDVKTRPHSVFPFNSPILYSSYNTAWSNYGPISVPPSTTTTISITFPDTQGQPIQGGMLTTNNNGDSDDYKCTSNEDGTGTNMASSGTGDGEFRVTSVDQKHATVDLQNHSATLTAYYKNLKVKMIGITETGDSISKVTEDAASILANSKRVLTLNNRWVQTTGMATAIGGAYLAILKDRTRSSISGLTYLWSGQELFDNLCNYDLGTYVNFGLPASDTSVKSYNIPNSWLIVGQEMTWVNQAGQDAYVKLYLERSDDVINAVHERSSSANTGAVPASSMSVSHQVDNRNSRLLVAFIGTRALVTVTNVTYGTQNFTKLGAINAATGNNPRAEIWYLQNPTVGTNTCTATLSGSDFAEMGLIGFYNTNNLMPISAAVTDFSASGTPAPTLNINSQPGDLVFDGISYNNAASATVGAGQTLVGTITSDGSWKLGVSKETGSGVATMSWTYSSAYAHIAATIKGLTSTPIVIPTIVGYLTQANGSFLLLSDGSKFQISDAVIS